MQLDKFKSESNPGLKQDSGFLYRPVGGAALRSSRHEFGFKAPVRFVAGRNKKAQYSIDRFGNVTILNESNKPKEPKEPAKNKTKPKLRGDKDTPPTK